MPSIAELNRRLRNLCEREGADYGPDATEDDEVAKKHIKVTGLMQKSIQGVLHDIKRARNVDLCFLVDATASMGPHIQGVKDSVHKIVQTLQVSRDNPGGIENLRFAVVAYRDFDSPQHFEILDFVEGADRCSEFCRKLRAFAGEDVPEDVFGGLDKATQLDWGVEAGTRIIFHMGDAPCHGKQYHDERLRDHYPNGDPQGRTEAGLFKKIKELNIDYYFGKITSLTDRMMEKFSIAYGKIIQNFDVAEVANIEGSVIESISTSTNTRIEQSKLGLGGAKLRQYQLEPIEPDWEKLQIQEGKYLEYKLPESIEDINDDVGLVEKEISNVRIKIAPHPFSEGSERIAFYGRDFFEGYGPRPTTGKRGRGGRAPPRVQRTDAAKPTQMVFKEYKHEGRRVNTLERYKTACEMQTVGFFMADRFNLEHKENIDIKFLKTKTLILGNTKSASVRFLTGERQLLGASGFVKFTNNGNYQMNDAIDYLQRHGISSHIVDLVQAFSHWTYHASNCYFMIVDLQGCICSVSPGSKEKKILMTDPAIHCKDITRYAPLNLGKQGMQLFFDQHQCNQICRQLRLPVTKIVN